MLHPIKVITYQKTFSCGNFLLQPNLSFRASLILLVLAAAAVIGNQPPAPPLSPIP